MARFNRSSHHNRELVGDELMEFDLAFRIDKHVRDGDTRLVGKMLAAGASIEGSPLMEGRPLMTAAGIS